MKTTTTQYKKRSGRWSRNRVLYLCLLASVLVHFFALVPVGLQRLTRLTRSKPRAVRIVSLKLAPRTSAGRRPPAAAAPRKAAEKAPARKAEGSRGRLSLEDVLGKYKRTTAVREKELPSGKSAEARAWVSQERAAYETAITREEAGEVGLRRIIDLRASSDLQIARLMGYYKMEIGYGSRVVTDLNLQFTSGWLFTKGQIRGYLARHTVAGARQILISLTPGMPNVELRESGEGATRPYIKPSIAALAAILTAEDKYFSSTETDPDKIESLVFTPVWSYRGVGFTVSRVENTAPQKGDANAAKDPQKSMQTGAEKSHS